MKIVRISRPLHPLEGGGGGGGERERERTGTSLLPPSKKKSPSFPTKAPLLFKYCIHFILFVTFFVIVRGGVTFSNCGQSSLKFEGPELTQVFLNITIVMSCTSLGKGRRIQCHHCRLYQRSLHEHHANVNKN